jgi:hypothetical protein
MRSGSMRSVCGGSGLQVSSFLKLLASFRTFCYPSFVRHLRHALGVRGTFPQTHRA